MKTVDKAVIKPHVAAMFTRSLLLSLIDQYKAASGVVSDGAISARLFNDGKKIAALRGGADITLGRVHAALNWLDDNWPEAAEKPLLLQRSLSFGRDQAEEKAISSEDAA